MIPLFFFAEIFYQKILQLNKTKKKKRIKGSKIVENFLYLEITEFCFFPLYFYVEKMQSG